VNPRCEHISCRVCRRDMDDHGGSGGCRPVSPLEHEGNMEELGSGERLGRCPGCGALCEKDGGCNRMYCVRCHSCFCWICGVDVTGQGYDHFTWADDDGCRLFNLDGEIDDY
jgi:hypothetical protein